ncbi:hypothetical protein [Methylobacterium sp.]|uniref:hypothetical protein n=1 Tax=Methylobacterium sp. TaxID=409 RepID=UPI0025CC2F72|nr:hypothetical protein [Methylobacterium sp.]MBY0259592.1 hypothetical protein [Methylobacterium sp.]
MQITLMVMGVDGAGSNGPAVKRSVPRERLTATVAPVRVCEMTPPTTIWSPDQVGMTSTSGVVVQAAHVKVATGAVRLTLDVAV